MALHRKITKIGGSLGIIIPRDFAESMGIENGSLVRLTTVGGRQLVVEPENNSASDEAHAIRTIAAAAAATKTRGLESKGKRR